MNVLLVSTSDTEGGAAIAAYRLHQGLQRSGILSQMLVQTQSSDDSTVLSPRPNFRRDFARLRSSLDFLPLKFYPQRQPTPFSCQWLPDWLASKTAQLAPDIVNLHWIGGGFVKIETLARLTQPLVWTLHDMWAFTGGCHYSQDCDRYTVSCGTCPQLGSHQHRDLSHWLWHRKARAWKQLNLTVVTPSQWLARCARSSSLFQESRIEVISYGIDTEIYRPIDQPIARNLLKLPQDRKIILFSAFNTTKDPRKGFAQLEAALRLISQTSWGEHISLLVCGSSKPPQGIELEVPIHFLGRLNDDISIALAYSAADLFVAPSMQDNLPNTVMESLACGTPCVAFKVGGMPDLIDHQVNGYLAKPFEVDDLAQGIIWILEKLKQETFLRQAAREKVEREFCLELQAKRYMALFEELLSNPGDR